MVERVEAEALYERRRAKTACVKERRIAAVRRWKYLPARRERSTSWAASTGTAARHKHSVWKPGNIKIKYSI